MRGLRDLRFRVLEASLLGKELPKWETVTYEGDADLYEETRRLKIAKGWLYERSVYSEEGSSTAMAFVPDDSTEEKG